MSVWIRDPAEFALKKAAIAALRGRIAVVADFDHTISSQKVDARLIGF